MRTATRGKGEEEVAHEEHAGKVSGRGDARATMNLTAAIHGSEEEEDDVAGDVELPRFLGSVMTTSTVRRFSWMIPQGQGGIVATSFTEVWPWPLRP